MSGRRHPASSSGNQQQRLVQALHPLSHPTATDTSLLSSLPSSSSGDAAEVPPGTYLPAHHFIRWQRSRSGAIPRLFPSFFRQHSRSADAADPTPSPLQVLALFFRPNKEHEYRVYWNFYHHIVGYAVIILGIINVFEGFSILNQWKNMPTS